MPVSPAVLRDLLDMDGRVDVSGLSDADLAAHVQVALTPVESDEDREERRHTWDPVDLLVPEWRYLQQDPLHDRHGDQASGLLLSKRAVSAGMPGKVARVLAVDRLRKVNALMGFTRIDDLDRITDVERRLVPLTRAARPEWTIATEDRGEGVFLQLDEEAVAAWETGVAQTPLWAAHREAHRRNFANRFSEHRGAARPGRAAQAGAVLAGAHLRPRAAARDGDAQRLRLGQPQRADLRLARRPRVVRRRPVCSSAPRPPTATARSAGSWR